jgi:hypothetical protein
VRHEVCTGVFRIGPCAAIVGGHADRPDLLGLGDELDAALARYDDGGMHCEDARTPEDIKRLNDLEAYRLGFLASTIRRGWRLLSWRRRVGGGRRGVIVLIGWWPMIRVSPTTGERVLLDQPAAHEIPSLFF